MSAVIALPASAAHARTGTGAGRTPSPSPDPGLVSVRDHGAVGDGKTDDAPAFRAALREGRVTLIPPGVYLLRSTVAVPSGATLRGAGPSSVLVVPDDGFTGDRVLTNADFENGNRDIVLEDFALRVTKARPVSGANAGIVRLQKVDGLTIRGLTTERFESMYTAVDLSGGIRNAVITGCRLRNANRIESGGALWIRGGKVDDPSLDSRNITVTGNVFESGYDEAFGLYGWFNVIESVAVSGNAIVNRGPTRLAVGIAGYNVAGQDGEVRDVVLNGNAIVGAINVLSGAARVTVIGNSIAAPDESARDGVLVNGFRNGGPSPQGVLIAENQIAGPWRYGIFAAGPRVVVRANSVVGSSRSGIYGGKGAAVESNTVEGGTTGIVSDEARSISRNIVTGARVGIAVVGSTAGVAVGDNLVQAADAGIVVNGQGRAVREVRLVRNQLTTGRPGDAIRVREGEYSECEADGNRAQPAGDLRVQLPSAGWRGSDVVRTPPDGDGVRR